MLTFEQALENIEEEVSVLLGNGFSQAWDADIFNYKNLFEAANFGANDLAIRAIFNRFETYDFETVMDKMLGALAVLEEYGAPAELIDKIVDDSSSLKTALISAIAQTHPAIPNNIEDGKYISARNFLAHFDNIFTLNYDLLMYWARNKSELEPTDFHSDDGFRARKKWQSYGTGQNVHFLHGSLHIYDTGTSIIKHTYSENGETIIDQVRENLIANKFPLFVSEPTYQKKQSKIEHNPYLNSCYEKLRATSGVLFIYGHSMDNSDKHIFDAVRLSAINKVMVSIYGDPNSDNNQRTMANARTYMERHGRTVDFYYASSVSVWNA